jgi:hypothetical protein
MLIVSTRLCIQNVLTEKGKKTRQGSVQRVPMKLTGWWAVSDLNAGPSGCKPDALTAELTARRFRFYNLRGTMAKEKWNCPSSLRVHKKRGGEIFFPPLGSKALLRDAAHVLPRLLLPLRFVVGLCCGHRIAQSLLDHNSVPTKHAGGSMTAQLHGHQLRDLRLNHCGDSRAPLWDSVTCERRPFVGHGGEHGIPLRTVLHGPFSGRESRASASDLAVR